ncbi:MAG: UDP-N-acetylmuramoyl-L-alanine--D-glutamate ligase [Candidatus Brocadiia bacterium]
MTDRPEPAPVALCPSGQLRALLGALDGRRVTLMGLGLFGGGEGAARFVVERGARLVITDLRDADALSEPLARLGDLGVECVLGRHRAEDFTECDLVIANPAVSRSNTYLRAAQAAGIPITSPMNIFLACSPAPVAAVTGSNGKSTTTALLAAMLEAAGRRVWMGGNIGVSLLPLLGEIETQDIVVLELSSFQLSDAGALPWSPHLAVVTNLTPNHLAWHGGFRAYAAAKRNIVRHQGDSDFAVLNGRSQVLCGWVREGVPGRAVLFDSNPRPGRLGDGMILVGDRLVWRQGRRDQVVCTTHDVPLPGFHNVENAMGAAAGALCLGADGPAVREALSTFVGLAHRLEPVGEWHGVRFYNDSYSTTAESVVAALESFRGPLLLIAGGYDKHLDLSAIAEAAARRVEVLVTIGQTGPELAQQTRREGVYVGRTVLVREADSLREAVLTARGLAMPGTAVVFSPGCASYDMFDNYRHRGEEFKRVVKEVHRQERARGA